MLTTNATGALTTDSSVFQIDLIELTALVKPDFRPLKNEFIALVIVFQTEVAVELTAFQAVFQVD